MKKIKTILYLMILSTFLRVGNVFAIFWTEKINQNLFWNTNNVDITIQNYIVNAFFFLYLAAVLYWLYWWFLILTAASDEEKVKKWKTIIIQALIWLVVIYLAWPIINFFLWWDWGTWILLDDNWTTTP
jgi:hypothetical protein